MKLTGVREKKTDLIAMGGEKKISMGAERTLHGRQRSMSLG